MIASVFGRTLVHLHRPNADDREGDDPDGGFWKRHHSMDNILLNTMQYLPGRLQLRSGIYNPQIVQLHMNIHASTICLHQAAVFKAGNSQQFKDIRSESRARCLAATESIMSIMRLVNAMVIESVSLDLPILLCHVSLAADFATRWDRG